MYTLAHDPIYRLGMSWQNTAYNQPPHLGFWLYGNKDKFPTPDITLVGDHTPKPAAIIKQGAGSSSQAIALGDSIVPFTFAIQNADGATVENLPAGVTAKWNAQTNSLYFSGTPAVSGEFTYTITTKGGDAEFGEATRSGKFTIDDPNAKTTSLKPRAKRALLNGSGHVYDLRGRLVKQRKHRGFYLTR
jgi:rhamnogalacturonan endolyase